jgi:hypothetical protein
MSLRPLSFRATALLGLLVCLGSNAIAADHYDLKPQSIELTSSGPLAFGPSGILFASDPKAATVYAIDTKSLRTQSTKLLGSQSKVDATDYASDDVRKAIAEITAKSESDVTVADMAIDPESGALFLSLAVAGEAKLAVMTPGVEAKLVSLDKVMAASTTLQNAPEDKVTGEGRRASNKRLESITDLAFAEGRLLISGLTGSSPVSTVQSFEFPFRDSSTSAQVEIFHAAHGRNEDSAAIRAFIPLNIDGKPSLLAGYTCTPLVRFSLDDLQSGSKVRGTTVAELGNRNRPLDMIVYEKDGVSYLLVTNTARGVMKMKAADIASQAEVTDKVDGGGTAGLPFEQIESLTGVVQLAKLNDQYAVILTETDNQSLKLSTIELP